MPKARRGKRVIEGSGTTYMCGWCCGDLRPMEGLPAVYVCEYCRRTLFLSSPVLVPPLETAIAEGVAPVIEAA